MTNNKQISNLIYLTVFCLYRTGRMVWLEQWQIQLWLDCSPYHEESFDQQAKSVKIIKHNMKMKKKILIVVVIEIRGPIHISLDPVYRSPLTQKALSCTIFIFLGYWDYYVRRYLKAFYIWKKMTRIYANVK